VELAGERSESGLAWRLRRLKRSVLRDAEMGGGFRVDDDFSLADPFEFLGRADRPAPRSAAGALFADISLDGMAGRSAHHWGLRQPVRPAAARPHPQCRLFFGRVECRRAMGTWTMRAAMNQGDLDSWMLAGNYAARAGATHRYEAGMTYSLQRYQGGNPSALAALPDTARNVGTLYAYDEWAISPALSVGYGATYANYDYLAEPSLLSPRLTATYAPAATWRIRGIASRQLSAPGAQEFLPPTRASWLPPQRTFAPLSRDGFRTQGLEHYEVGVEKLMNGARVGVRVFQQQIDDQMVTLFGVRQQDTTAEALGHYYVGRLATRRCAVWVSRCRTRSSTTFVARSSTRCPRRGGPRGRPPPTPPACGASCRRPCIAPIANASTM
jgi:outer membrane receptor protein involved in Fe transport